MPSRKDLVRSLSFFFPLAACGALLPAAEANEAPACYRTTALPLKAVALNQNGEVAGEVEGPRAALTGRNGHGLQLIAGLSGHTSAVAINARGQAAAALTDGPARIFITDANGGKVREVPRLPGVARSMNNRGQIVGEVFERAFITEPGARDYTVLGVLYPGDTASDATAVNEAGHIVGTSYSASTGIMRAFITGPQGRGMRDLGGLGGKLVIPQAINERGEVVGQSLLPMGEFFRCFSTEPLGRRMRDIGSLGGMHCSARGINNRGDIVGGSYIAGDTALHAFVKYRQQPVLVDLNLAVDPADLEEAAYLTVAKGINDKGQIIADASNGRSYLLTPCDRMP